MKPHPTALEQKVLHRLWDLGGTATVSEVIEGWPDREKPGYTTVLKVLQNMEAKGLADHERSGRAYRYRSLLAKDKVSRGRLRELLNRFYSGDALRLVNALVEEVDLSPAEAREIRRILAARAKETAE